MAYRLSQGKGEAFYQVGICDNGTMVGIGQEDILESLIVLFHIASQLEATLEVNEVRLGQDEGYSIELRVTKHQPETVDSELVGFFQGLNFLNSKKVT